MGIILIIVLMLIAWRIDKHMETMEAIRYDLENDSCDFEGVTDADEMQAIYNDKHNINEY